MLSRFPSLLHPAALSCTTATQLGHEELGECFLQFHTFFCLHMMSINSLHDMPNVALYFFLCLLAEDFADFLFLKFISLIFNQFLQQNYAKNCNFFFSFLKKWF
jgi:hypothetical protein